MRQLRASTRALAAIVARADGPRAAAWYATWSVRRKGRGILERSTARGDSRHDDGTAILTDLRSRVAHDQAVIDYAVLDTAVAALVVTDAATRVVRLPIDADSLRVLVSALYSRLSARVGSFIDLSRASLDASVARALYTGLLQPLEPWLAGRTRLTIVPDAPLHIVPFDALIVSGPDSATEYAVDRYTIYLAASLVADGGPVVTIRDGPVVAIAGPAVNAALLESRREIAAVGNAFSNREVIQFVDGDATESAIRQRAGSAAVLHFAAHARPNVHDPDHSMIALAAAGDDDGLLHAYEVRNLDLAESLVVLSGCESAAGRLLGGEGPLSLGRAFLQARASHVVATLWPVGPATAEFMEMFYEALGRGEPPADALRHAKLSLRAGPGSNALYWAPFVLILRGT